jgi:predicted metal-dependent peptidase
MSGSISELEASQFLGEVYDMAGYARVKVVCWDSKAYEPVEARSRNEVVSKVLSSLKGRGGTVIRGALEKTLASMRANDMVVVLTDGEIYDLDDPATMKLFSDVSSKSSVSVFVSTCRKVSIPGWRFIELEVE